MHGANKLVRGVGTVARVAARPTSVAGWGGSQVLADKCPRSRWRQVGGRWAAGGRQAGGRWVAGGRWQVAGGGGGGGGG